MSLPNLKTVHLKLSEIISALKYKFLPSVFMRELTTLKIDLFLENKHFYSDLSFTIHNMPNLLDLTVMECGKHFCTDYIFDIIETVTSQGKYVLVEAVKNVHNYCTKNVEIYRKQDLHLNIPCFKVSIKPENLDNFNNACFEHRNKLLSKYKIHKQGF